MARLIALVIFFVTILVAGLAFGQTESSVEKVPASELAGGCTQAKALIPRRVMLQRKRSSSFNKKLRKFWKTSFGWSIVPQEGAEYALIHISANGLAIESLWLQAKPVNWFKVAKVAMLVLATLALFAIDPTAILGMAWWHGLEEELGEEEEPAPTRSQILEEARALVQEFNSINEFSIPELSRWDEREFFNSIESVNWQGLSKAKKVAILVELLYGELPEGEPYITIGKKKFSWPTSLEFNMDFFEEGILPFGISIERLALMLKAKGIESPFSEVKVARALILGQFEPSADLQEDLTEAIKEGAFEDEPEEISLEEVLYLAGLSPVEVVEEIYQISAPEEVAQEWLDWNILKSSRENSFKLGYNRVGEFCHCRVFLFGEKWVEEYGDYDFSLNTILSCHSRAKGRWEACERESKERLAFLASLSDPQYQKIQEEACFGGEGDIFGGRIGRIEVLMMMNREEYELSFKLNQEELFWVILNRLKAERKMLDFSQEFNFREPGAFDFRPELLPKVKRVWSSLNDYQKSIILREVKDIEWEGDQVFPKTNFAEILLKGGWQKWSESSWGDEVISIPPVAEGAEGLESWGNLPKSREEHLQLAKEISLKFLSDLGTGKKKVNKYIGRIMSELEKREHYFSLRDLVYYWAEDNLGADPEGLEFGGSPQKLINKFTIKWILNKKNKDLLLEDKGEGFGALVDGHREEYTSVQEGLRYASISGFEIPKEWGWRKVAYLPYEDIGYKPSPDYPAELQPKDQDQMAEWANPLDVCIRSKSMQGSYWHKGSLRYTLFFSGSVAVLRKDGSLFQFRSKGNGKPSLADRKAFNAIPACAALGHSLDDLLNF